MLLGVAATPDVALPTLDWLLTSHYQLDRVITQPDRPSGRGQKVNTSAVSDWAQRNCVKVFKPVDNLEIKDAISGLDLLITIGYGRILPQELLTIPTFGCVNLHFSLLPKYRGAAPVQRAIQNGESSTGVTVFRLDAGMDTGPIYTSATVAIDKDDRSYELLAKLAQIGVTCLADAITQIENGVMPKAQSGSASIAKKITKQEAEIDWNNSSSSVVNAIRAFYPQPGAWSLFRGQSLKITDAEIVPAQSQLAPGELLTVDGYVLVGAADGAISLKTVVPSGKNEMSALDWSRGARFASGESLG